MNDLNTIHSARLIIPFVASPPLAHEDPAAKSKEAACDCSSRDASRSDSVELSAGAARLADTLADPEIRVQKVARVRSEIQNGVYDTTGKLEAVLNRILDDIA